LKVRWHQGSGQISYFGRYTHRASLF
jgi:hypothetical protein